MSNFLFKVSQNSFSFSYLTKIEGKVLKNELILWRNAFQKSEGLVWQKTNAAMKELQSNKKFGLLWQFSNFPSEEKSFRRCYKTVTTLFWGPGASLWISDCVCKSIKKWKEIMNLSHHRPAGTNRTTGAIPDSFQTLTIFTSFQEKKKFWKSDNNWLI